MKNLFLILLFAIFSHSCTHNYTTTEPDSSKNSNNTSRLLMPLKVGNVWVYQKTNGYYNGHQYDTVKTEETWTMINSRQQTWQLNGIWDTLLTAQSYTFLVSNAQKTDTNGLIFVDHKDSLFFGWPLKKETIVTVFTIPDTSFNVFDKSNWGVQYSSTYFAQYSTFNVPYGNLDGFKLYEMFGNEKSGEFYIFSPGIGLIWASTADWEIKLKSYSLK